MKTVRFGVSLDEDLLTEFDRYVADKGMPTRSEALKNMMREKLDLEMWRRGSRIAGSVTFAYDYRKPGVVEKLLDVQREYSDEIVCSQRASLGDDLCMETIAVHGCSKRIDSFINNLRQVKGLGNVALTVVCTELQKRDGHDMRERAARRGESGHMHGDCSRRRHKGETQE